MQQAQAGSPGEWAAGPLVVIRKIRGSPFPVPLPQLPSHSSPPRAATGPASEPRGRIGRIRVPIAVQLPRTRRTDSSDPHCPSQGGERCVLGPAAFLLLPLRPPGSHRAGAEEQARAQGRLSLRGPLMLMQSSCRSARKALGQPWSAVSQWPLP